MWEAVAAFWTMLSVVDDGYFGFFLWYWCIYGKLCLMNFPSPQRNACYIIREIYHSKSEENMLQNQTNAQMHKAREMLQNQKQGVRKIRETLSHNQRFREIHVSALSNRPSGSSKAGAVSLSFSFCCHHLTQKVHNNKCYHIYLNKF